MKTIQGLSNAMPPGLRRSCKKYLFKNTPKQSEVSEGPTNMKLDPQCIVKSGYLVKSPPLEKIKNKMARWHMRWFVLYDTKLRSEIDPSVEREIELLYYINHDSATLGELPKGKISLIGAEVSAQYGKVHGFSFVINIQTVERTYYLCATQRAVHQDWFYRIREHYIPLSVVNRPSVLPPCSGSLEPQYSPDIQSTNQHKSVKREKTTDCVTHSSGYQKSKLDKMCEQISNTAPISPSSSYAFWAARDYMIGPLPTSPLSRTNQLNIEEMDNYDDDNDDDLPPWRFKETQQLKLKQTMSQLPAHFIESDTDEGIVRTSSDSSSTSTNTQVTTTRIIHSAMDNSFDDFGGGFKGPKLSPSKKSHHQNSYSLFDLVNLSRTENLFVPISADDATMNLLGNTTKQSNRTNSRPNSQCVSFEACL